MAGIYLHIPFCRHACNYCNFHFTTSLRRKNDFIAALLKEIALRKDYIVGEPVETIYFGGGTPSLLAPDELDRLMEGVSKHFILSQTAEVTLETNPDDISAGQLAHWKRAGI